MPSVEVPGVNNPGLGASWRIGMVFLPAELLEALGYSEGVVHSPHESRTIHRWLFYMRVAAARRSQGLDCVLGRSDRKNPAAGEITPLKESAYRTTAAVKIHTESCAAWQKAERRRWFWPEEKGEPISIKHCTDFTAQPGVVLRHALVKMAEKNQDGIETAHLHADALQVRLQSLQSQLALGFTLCKMARTEINFGEIEEARKIVGKVRHSSETIRHHLAEPNHVPQPKTDLYEQLTKLETNIGEVETLLRQKDAHESPATP